MIDLPLPESIRHDFWGLLDDNHALCNGQPARQLDMFPYMEYYKRQWNNMVADADGRYITIRTYGDVLDIIRLINKDRTREEIISHLGSKSPSATTEAYENSVNLAARLLLMLKIGVVKHQAVPRHYITWDQGTLADLVKERFNEVQVLDTCHVRLPKSFNAWSINVIGGLEIEFTDNLADHLLLVDDDTKVLIFHHASFLECQRRSLFPEGLADEALRTLALIFPQSEFRSRRGKTDKSTWFRKLCSSSSPCSVDPRITLCGNLRAEDRQIEHFKFWRDRLIILKQAYDDSSPKTLSQWWHDRRNGERWYTFWIAVLVFIVTTTVGIIQCIESGMQVYKAYVPTPS
ncbi:hypothetical protein K445DRAFT_311087 [Daldinia sp. EC12]|nr:hypothetical protein K445DRAFT_311087 [Daldinia sp. EC12]